MQNEWEIACYNRNNVENVFYRLHETLNCMEQMKMKVGVRKPSVSKRVKARTTGKVKRSVKKAVNPYYGKKGMGMIRDPKKAVYNKVYSKTTIGVDDLLAAGASRTNKRRAKNYSSDAQYHAEKPFTTGQLRVYSKLFKILSVLFFLFAALGLLTEIYSILALGLITGIFLWVQAGKYKKMMTEMETEDSSLEEDKADSDIEFNMEEDPIDISVDIDSIESDK